MHELPGWISKASGEIQGECIRFSQRGMIPGWLRIGRIISTNFQGANHESEGEGVADEEGKGAEQAHGAVSQGSFVITNLNAEGGKVEPPEETGGEIG